MHLTSYKSGLPIFLTDGIHLAVGAKENSRPIGLLLCKTDDNYQCANILAVYVKPEYRNQGLASAMFQQLEKTLKLQGFKKIKIEYYQNSPTISYFEKILKKLNWSAPLPQMLICRVKCEKLMTADWISKYKLTPDFSVFLWSEITTKEKEKILANEDKKGWYTKQFNPFLFEANMVKFNSLGLKYKDTIIGWIIVTHFSDDALNYPKLFICEEYQNSGKAIVLLAEAVKLQATSKIPYGLFAFEINNKKMRLFYEKRFKPYMDATYLKIYTEKIL
jgi:GNAT superfamily N-acetyltransferase